MNKFCDRVSSYCICATCKVKPIYPLTGISIISTILGVSWMGMGLWMTIIVCMNSRLPFEKQLFFEKWHKVDPEEKLFHNESSFIYTPLENLKFYLLSLSFITAIGGLGRTVASLSLLHYVNKKALSYTTMWAWTILHLLVIITVTVIAVDVLYTLSHNSAEPPNHRDFYFKNDQFEFYPFCYIFMYALVIDFLIVCYFQCTIRCAQRRYPVSDAQHPDSNA